MISNRRGARRSASPVERLREFAINTSKGIDVTQAPVNSDTVVHAKNLIVNPDGSLSLRKPISTLYTYAGAPHPLYNGDTVCVCKGNDGIEYLKFSKQVKYTYYSHTGKFCEDTYANGELRATILVPLKFIQLNTATLMSCEVLAFNPSNASDSDLINRYITDVGSTTGVRMYVPRYVRILDLVTHYELFVYNPQPNELSSSTPNLNPNLTLDDPYSVSDVKSKYSNITKGILCYGNSTRDDNNPPEPIAWTPALEDAAKVVYLPALSGSKTVKLPDSSSLIVEIPFNVRTTTLHDVTVTVRVTFRLGGNVADGNTAEAHCSVVANAVSKTPYEWLGSFTAKVIRKAVTVALKFTKNKTVTQSKTLTLYSTTRETTSLSSISMYSSTDTPDTGANPLTIGDADSVDVSVTIPEDILGLSFAVEDVIKIPNNVPGGVLNMSTCLKTDRFRPLASIAINDLDNAASPLQYAILKAFGQLYAPLVHSKQEYYASWFYSYDGVTWIPCYFPIDYFGYYDDTVEYPIVNVVNSEGTVSVYSPIQFSSEYTDTYGGIVANRPDFLTIRISENSPAMYKFRVVTIKPYDGDVRYNVPVVAEDILVSEMEYNIPYGESTEFYHVNFENAVYGNKLYHKKRIYSYGHEKFFNNIFVSDIDNFETPLYNIIDIDAKQSDNVSAVIPWRDYLMSATSNSIYLHTPQDNGFLTKTVTTSLGISKEDSQCCVSVLNGVVTKSGSKIYLIYPNVYSGTDDVLNVAPISQPVDEYLQDFEDNSEEKPFAFSTESEYILMLPYPKTETESGKTICLRYNYTTRIWCMCEYPVRLYDYRINNVEDIRLYGILENGGYAEFKFDADSDNYVDVIGTQEIPIEFEWDSGQKTDNIATRKQFVESKIAFTTEDAIEDFPMELIVAVDGDPNLVRIDVRTDAPLIKTEGSVGVLGTQIRASEGDTSIGVSNRGLVRHLIVRYSGRGRSVRHVLMGTAKSPFRLYEAYIRYKLLDNKR